MKMTAVNELFCSQKVRIWICDMMLRIIRYALWTAKFAYHIYMALRKIREDKKPSRSRAISS